MFLFFHYWFSPLFFGCFHCFHWLHFFMLPTFFTMTAFLLLFCQVIHYYVVVPRMLRIREDFFYSLVIFTLHFFQFAIVPRVLRIWERFFCSEAFFTLNSSFPTFGTTCFYQGFPENLMFFFEDCRVSHWETQTRPIFLFESHSVQQKVLLGRFHLCIKALQSTISTSSRLWTHYLLSTYIKMCMSYSLDQRIY